MSAIVKVSPVAAWLTVNRRCNFRCKWCYAKGTHYGPELEMSIETAKGIVDILHKLAVQMVIIIGGEPTMWEPLSELVRYCRDYGIRTNLVTNGARFGDDYYWESYQAEPCDQVGISVKGGSPKQLLQIAGVRNFEQVKNGIARAVEKYQTGVSTVYSTLIEDSLIEIVQFAHEVGAKYFKLEFCSTVFSEGKPLSEYMVEPRKAVSNILRDYPMMSEIMNGEVIFEMNMPFCLWPEEFLTKLVDQRHIISVCHIYRRSGIIFDVDGSIMVCNGLFDYPIGRLGVDFSNAESLIDHINKPEVNNYYDQLVRMPLPLCGQCEWYDKCGGGCPLKWAIYNPEELIVPMGLRR